MTETVVCKIRNSKYKIQYTEILRNTFTRNQLWHFKYRIKHSENSESIINYVSQLSRQILVTHNPELCKNGLTDRNVIWSNDSGGRNELLDGGRIPPEKGAVFLRGKYLPAHCEVYNVVYCNVMSMWSLRWHFTNMSVTGAPYNTKSYSMSRSWIRQGILGISVVNRSYSVRASGDAASRCHYCSSRLYWRWTSSVATTSADPMSDTVALHASRLVSSPAVKRTASVARRVRYIIRRRPGSPTSAASCPISDNRSVMSTCATDAIHSFVAFYFAPAISNHKQ